uniref:Medium-chain acyl-CoA ligase ACSF2, mitochondrial n=1 Tax=Amblyomma maculatum TaxID=34609 RepID=G3MNF1_AMBMU
MTIFVQLSAARFLRLHARNVASRPLSSQPAAHKKLLSSHWLELCAKPLSQDTLGTCIDAAAQKWGERQGWAFVQEEKLCSYAEYKKQVDQLARGLLCAGFSKGDPLMIWSPSTFNWILMAGAAAKAGVLSASTHFGFTPPEFEKCLSAVDFKGIYIPRPFKSFNYYEMLCSLIPELRNSQPGRLVSKKYPSLRTVITDSDQQVPGCVSLQELMHGGEVDLQAAQEAVTAGDPFTIVFTSGTTGTPKAAVLSHANFVNNVLTYDQRAKLTQETVMCNPLPFFHVYGLSVVLARPLVLGAKAVVPAPAYDAAAVLKAIQEHRCTELCGSPTMFLDIINSPLRKQHDISSLQQGESGGNVVTPAVRNLVREKLNIGVRVGYGTTELTTAAMVTSVDDPIDKQLNTVGRPLPHLEVKIVDPSTGREVPVNSPGEVWGRGPNVFLGYYNDDRKTREVMTPDGWYKTGDVGVMDEDGYVIIVSRLKDVVNRGGEKVYPTEVEEFFHTHPAVQECHVIGVPDERLGEEVCAWIVPRADAKVTDEELREHCQGKLSHFKIPRYFIYDAKVPKTPIGKPQKALMRLLAAEKLGLTR